FRPVREQGRRHAIPDLGRRNESARHDHASEQLRRRHHRDEVSALVRTGTRSPAHRHRRRFWRSVRSARLAGALAAVLLVSCQIVADLSHRSSGASEIGDIGDGGALSDAAAGEGTAGGKHGGGMAASGGLTNGQAAGTSGATSAGTTGAAAGSENTNAGAGGIVGSGGMG